jgi:6-hydroxytryprostatin B O-methyltransferase
MLEHKSAAGVQSEMQFQVHDFFGPNPQQSADIYFLRHIIHDWGDENSARILKCIANVMKPSAKILIVDIVVPEPKTLPWHAHRMIRYATALGRNHEASFRNVY